MNGYLNDASAVIDDTLAGKLNQIQISNIRIDTWNSTALNCSSSINVVFPSSPSSHKCV